MADEWQSWVVLLIGVAVVGYLLMLVMSSELKRSLAIWLIATADAADVRDRVYKNRLAELKKQHPHDFEERETKSKLRVIG
jgi:cytochrome c-type biogenesis protein CcmH/NrfG